MREERCRFGHLRCRETRKPTVFAPPVHFFLCPVCGRTSMTMGEEPGGHTCCGQPSRLLVPREAEDWGRELRLSYQIVGSLNENAVLAQWQSAGEGEQPEWIWLGTFSGGQMKYIRQGTKPPAVFGLAGADAYAYCDKDPCVQCTFRCKRGFGLYFYFRKRGLLYLPLDRMSTRQQGL